jgi:hypothetical protein
MPKATDKNPKFKLRKEFENLSKEELEANIRKWLDDNKSLFPTDEYDDFGNVKVNLSNGGVLFMRAEGYHKMMEEAYRKEINKDNDKNI